MTSKLAVLTLIPMIVTTSAGGALWENHPVHEEGLLVLNAGPGTICQGTWQIVTRWAKSWRTTYDTKGCYDSIRYKMGETKVIGPCGIKGTYSLNRNSAQLTLDGYIWYCNESGHIKGENDGRVYGTYDKGVGNRKNGIGLDKNIVNVGTNGKGEWSSGILTLKGVNLKQITVLSNRDVTVNLGDEELTIRKGVTAEIPPPRPSNQYESTLKLFFHGRVTDKGTTTYNIRLNATFI
ncbi:hypothetical protein HIJ13_004928 [Escherichia coli]|nr:hypothetical protein [Escherichia coli]